MQPENQQQDGEWSYKPEGQSANEASVYEVPQQSAANQNSVSWTASEFIAHHKDAQWYTTIVGGFIALCAVIFLLTRDVISIVTISIVFILFLILSNKKPQQKSYAVDAQGISIGSNFYPYDLFKSFGVSREGAIGSVTFLPLKRIMPELSLYYAPDDEEKILGVLSENLPNEQRAEKTTDRLMKHLRF